MNEIKVITDIDQLTPEWLTSRRSRSNIYDYAFS